MIDIEELAIKLSQSKSFRLLIRSQVVECIQDNLNKNGEEKDITLAQLSKQIAGQLSQITQFVLEEQNSSNFMSLMRNNEEMCRAIQNKMKLQFQANMDALNTKIEKLNLKLEQFAANTKQKNINTDSAVLKQQRKIITKSILNNSRFVTNNKTKSSITPRHLKQIKFDSCEFESNDKQATETNDSHSIPLLQDDFCQDTQSLENHPILHNLKSKIEQTTNQALKMQQSLVTLSQKVDIKLENSLQGLWNVLGDLNARVAKLESKLQGTDGIDLYNE